MKLFLQLCAITLPIFLAIDVIWIGIVAKGFYAQHLGFLMKKSPNWAAAILFYLLYVVGLVFFVIYPALKTGSWPDALLRGALFGLVAYATYDLTNLVTIEGWPPLITVVDLAWGTFLTASVAVLSYWASSRLISEKI
jgi:uncharacterized membrane protein